MLSWPPGEEAALRSHKATFPHWSLQGPAQRLHLVTTPRTCMYALHQKLQFDKLDWCISTKTLPGLLRTKNCFYPLLTYPLSPPGKALREKRCLQARPSVQQISAMENKCEERNPRVENPSYACLWLNQWMSAEVTCWCELLWYHMRREAGYVAVHIPLLPSYQGGCQCYGTTCQEKRGKSTLSLDLWISPKPYSSSPVILPPWPRSLGNMLQFLSLLTPPFPTFLLGRRGKATRKERGQTDGEKQIYDISNFQPNIAQASSPLHH